MYRFLVRPLLFLIPPERVHYFVIGALRLAFRLPCLHSFFRRYYFLHSPKLERRIGSLVFPNPVGLAGGFDKNADSYYLLDCFGFGFAEIGTVTPRPQPGNPKPRLFRLKADMGLINRMGFNNQGADVAAGNLRKHPHRVPIAGNIGKNTPTDLAGAHADYLQCCIKLYPVVDFFVVNVSCPNIGNLTELQDGTLLPEILVPLTRFADSQDVRKPFFLKIGPDLSENQLDKVIQTVYDCHFDGIVAVNTTTSREGLLTPASSVEAIGRGGLSGAVLLPKTLRTISYIAGRTNGHLPVIGVGGIMSAADALRVLSAGAWLVEVYTGFVYEGPGIVRNINKQLLSR